MTLPHELIPTVIAYLAKEELKPLFEVPVIGPLCFNKYFETVRVDYLGVEDFHDTLEDDGEIVENATDYTDSITGSYFKWVPDHRTCVRFLTLHHFVRFCVKYQDIYSFNHVIFNHMEYFYQFRRDHAAMFQRFKKIAVTIAFYESFEADEDTSFMSKVSAEVRRFDDTCGAIDLDFLRILCFSYESPLMPIGCVLPQAVNKGHLTNMRINNVKIDDPAAFFRPFSALKNLYLHRVPLAASDLASLPPGLSKLTLLFSVRLAEASTELVLPPHLIFLSLVGLKVDGAPDSLIYVDLTQSTSLKGVVVTDAHFGSLADLRLPPSLEHLCINNCKYLSSLATVDRYTSLVSLSVFSCYRLSVTPSVFSLCKMPASIQTFRYEAVGGTNPDFQDSIAQEYVPGNASHYHTLNGMRYLKVDGSFAIPAAMTKMSIMSPVYVLTSEVVFPSNLSFLTLGNFGAVLDLSNLRLPASLARLRITSIDLHEIDGLQFPPRLEGLEVTSCKLGVFRNTNLRQLTRLQEVSFFNNALTDDSDVVAQIPPSVEVLVLQSNLITRADLAHITALKDANLSGCRFEAITDSTLRLPPQLEKLKLQNNRISVIADSFKFSDSIKTLKLESNNIPIFGNTSIKNLPKSLEYFSIARNSTTFQKGGLALPPNLESLNVFCNDSLDDLFPKISECQNLKYIFAASSPADTLDLDLLPSSLVQCDFSEVRCAHLKGNIGHLTRLKSFGFNIKARDEIVLKLPPALQFLELDLQYGGPKVLSKHIDWSNCSSLVQISLEGPDIDETDLIQTLTEIKNSSPLSILKCYDRSDRLASKVEQIGVSLSDA